MDGDEGGKIVPGHHQNPIIGLQTSSVKFVRGTVGMSAQLLECHLAAPADGGWAIGEIRQRPIEEVCRLFLPETQMAKVITADEPRVGRPKPRRN